ncbi:response regulator [Limnohabitans sp. Rim8]|uniref:response regulator transcription factor n=1 Tax=Limnohabitans sp. Rim8 TaxID=1100718 RepID=UPI0025DD0580|nr:response regulator [Limnohabitans sp. Rim8]
MAGHDSTRVIGSASLCGEWQSTPSLRVAKRHGNRGLPSLSGVDVQARLNEMGLGLAVIFVSGESTVQQAVTAMEKGALQFLVKPVSRSELLDAVALGMQKELKRLEELKRRHVRDGCLARLAPREREVLDSLMKG